ncbi:MAG: AAA family ATPase [Aurantibacter sp.]
MNPKKIVITGGPATGKTSVVQRLENAGYKCFREIIRDLTLAAKQTGDLQSLTINPIASVSDPLEFNRKLLRGRIGQFKLARNVAEDLVFFDRGIPDILAYMDYFDQTQGPEFIEAATTYKYDVIFLLPMWEQIFATDEERFESYDEALKIQTRLRETYSGYGYDLIEVPPDSIENRMEFILEQANR